MLKNNWNKFDKKSKVLILTSVVGGTAVIAAAVVTATLSCTLGAPSSATVGTAASFDALVGKIFPHQKEFSFPQTLVGHGESSASSTFNPLAGAARPGKGWTNTGGNSPALATFVSQQFAKDYALLQDGGIRSAAIGQILAKDGVSTVACGQIGHIYTTKFATPVNTAPSAPTFPQVAQPATPSAAQLARLRTAFIRFLKLPYAPPTFMKMVLSVGYSMTVVTWSGALAYWAAVSQKGMTPTDATMVTAAALASTLDTIILFRVAQRIKGIVATMAEEITASHGDRSVPTGGAVVNSFEALGASYMVVTSILQNEAAIVGKLATILPPVTGGSAIIHAEPYHLLWCPTDPLYGALQNL